jgi:hypothetical protein
MPASALTGRGCCGDTDTVGDGDRWADDLVDHGARRRR